jgi:Glycosyl transferase family 11.
MIIVKVCEGLGNQLFQYAFARSIQIKSGKKVFLDVSDYTNQRFPLGRRSTKRNYQLEHFNIKINKAGKKELQKYYFLISKGMVGKWISILEEHHLWMYKVFIQQNAWEYKENYLKIKGNVYYKGWFQNPKYFSSIREQLIKEITPKNKIHIQPELRRLLQGDNTVAVHCRRGDYKYIRNCLPVEYYAKAIAYMEEKLETPQYLFFSDDLPWAREQFGNKENFYYIDSYGRFEDYEELMIMSKCRNIIIANSTFSWWAAWLNSYENKVVIMPHIWAYARGKRVEVHDFPSDWIRI